MPEASKAMEAYFAAIDSEVSRAYKLAEAARSKGFDPEERVDIPLARNMAERVEGLISVAAPQLVGKGVPKRIEELEKRYGALAWEVALIIAEEVANERFCKFKDKREAMEVGIRTGFAYHTVGIVAAPLEGFIELRIKKRRDGQEYLAAAYAGPVRGAGGTAASVSVIITDYVRVKMGYMPYDPDDAEVNRYVTELADYDERVTNLQYRPSPEEIGFLVRHIPVEVTGDPTERIEVSNYKDLPRVETNRIRGGVCLVMSMLALKAPKLWRPLSKWGNDFGLEWGFMERFLEIQKMKKSKKKPDDAAHKKGISPDFTYITDLVAGRPVLTYPLRHGGFRLRYGRARTTGYSAAGIHPSTMVVLDKYIAIGTQLKTERPGKAAAVTSVDSIEPPIVKLDDGSVLRLENPAEARQLAKQIAEIIYLGDILFSYGDFFDRSHVLVPAGYCEEWYLREVEAALGKGAGKEGLATRTGISSDAAALVLSGSPPGFSNALSVSQMLNLPMHPRYTYHWNALTKEQLLALVEWLGRAKIELEGGGIRKLILPLKGFEGQKRSLELIGLPHRVASKEFVVVFDDDAAALVTSLGLNADDDGLKTSAKEAISISGKDRPLNVVLSGVSGITLRDKSGTFIGARMGRPEKAKMRRLTGSPQVLFPVGEEGGRLRCFQSAIEAGHVTADFPIRRCLSCNRETLYPTCELCGSRTRQLYYCRYCGAIDKECSHDPQMFRKQSIDVKHYYEHALKLSKVPPPSLVKGVRGTSNKTHVPEHLVKGVLRAKNEIAVNKDGTTRYDMTEVPITHFKQSEVETPIKRLVELGYDADINGNPLENEDQILELKPQDLILPSNLGAADESSDAVLFRVACFVDDLLKSLYRLKPYYNLRKKDDLIGHIVIGLAPHISAGIVGRIIGFSKTQGMFAHPLFHAAMRRDADGDEACVMLLMDALLNFSRQFLPDKRGSRTMDSPLVLTSRLIPTEVDDMVHRLDIAWRYPLELYQAAAEYKLPYDVKVDQLGNHLGTPQQYEGIGYTHETGDINNGVLCSAYKLLPSMEDKLKGQMTMAEKLRAVDEGDVARLVIEKHFIKDIKGNLRKFSTQQFRCVKCNRKFRRPTLIGKCDGCGGRVIFTVSDGSVVKYLEPAISLASRYNVPAYLKQSLDLTKQRVEEVFGKEKEKQLGLGAWFAAA